ncbi:alpha/beta hydrolase [bacterium]|nr:alpha/beta hydrolase [bacterium]
MGAPPASSSSDVRVVNDITYYKGNPIDAVAHMLDLYLPREGKDWPVVVLIHGGAWFAGNKRYVAPLAMELARNGIAVASANYRLTPRVRHPGHVKDVARAIAWVRRNIDRYDGNPDALFLAGHSAGGHLVSLVALDRGYLGEHGIDPDTDIAGVMPISGVYEIDTDVLEPAFGNDRDDWRDASPIEHVHPSAPPFFVFFAEHEMQGDIPLVAQAGDFFDALIDEGVPAYIREIRGANHDTIVTQTNGPAGTTAKEMVKFVEQYE